MKRTTSIILIIMMILAFPLNAYSSYLVDKGVCGMNGDNITWTLDSDGLLTISGTGEIPEFPGWDPSGVIVMDIQPGITSIGKDACSGSGAIQVNIPEGVISIKDGAFDYSNSLTHIVIPNGVKTLGKYCFSRCQNLSRVELPSSLESIDNQCFNYFLLKDIYYTGTEEQWNKIDIYNRDNLEKQNTRIHFNSHMPDDTRIAVATA